MSGLPSRPHDRRQGAASNPLFTDYSRHFMTDDVRIQIARSKNSSASSRRSGVALCPSQPDAVDRAPRTLRRRACGRLRIAAPLCTSLPLLTICFFHFAPTHQSKPIPTHLPAVSQYMSALCRRVLSERLQILPATFITTPEGGIVASVAV